MEKKAEYGINNLFGMKNNNKNNKDINKHAIPITIETITPLTKKSTLLWLIRFSEKVSLAKILNEISKEKTKIKILNIKKLKFWFI